MKFLFLLFITALLLPLSASPHFATKPRSPRSVKMNRSVIMMISKGKVKFQLYVPARSPEKIKQGAVQFALYLSEISGTKITPVSKLPADKNITVLRYGDAAFAKANKVDLAKLDRDGFVIASYGNQILIAGADAVKDDKGHGTLFGAQDFLERFADVRFYFPGKFGTLLPRKKDWSVPGMVIFDRPDHQYRDIYWGNSCKWHDPSLPRHTAIAAHKKELRLNTSGLYNCHGLAYMGYVKRFVKTHPEYFATRMDGTRADGSVVRDPSDASGHICFSSGIMEEIYQDARAMMSSRAAVDKRNMTGAAKWYIYSGCFNMMPNDSMVRCRCKKCAPYHEGLGIASGYSDKAADFLWERLLSIPNRLKKEKVPGFITMMAYDLCREVPKRQIPDNVIMQFAHFGPWGKLDPAKQKKDIELMARWAKKMGFKIYTWNYATKAAARGVPFVPNFTPKAIGEYYKSLYPYSFGTFLESGTDHWIFSHLNNYMFSKVMWDINTDPEALLADYRKRMFGAGAAPMKEFMETLERHWIKDVINNVVMTAIGPVVRPPSEYKVMNTIYSPKEIKRINALFDKAEKLAAKDKGALGRIKFLRKTLWGPMNNASRDYFKKASAIEKWVADAAPLKAGEQIIIDGKGNDTAWSNAPSVTLIPLGKNEAEVLTTVKMLYDKENLYFLFDCKEPHTDKMFRTKRKFDDSMMWSDNAIEIHLDPTGTRKENYQFMIDTFGGLTDLRVINKPFKNDFKWNSGAEAKSTVLPGKGWFAEVRIPLKSIPKVNGNKIVANFNRHRILNGINVHNYYTWSPYAKTFGDQANFGYIHLGIRENKNKLSDGDFLHSGIKWSKKSDWTYSGPMPKRDTRCFRTAGVSLLLEGHRSGMAHRIKGGIKPNTTYSLSFFVRQENVKLNPGKGTMGSGFYVRVDDGNGVVRKFPRHPFFGSVPWTRWEFTYRTSDKKPGTTYKPYLHFVLRNSSGRVWVDHVKLTEVPDKK